MHTLPPQELTDEQRTALEKIPVLPNPYYDWLKMAAKNAAQDRHLAAAAKAVVEISDEHDNIPSK